MGVIDEWKICGFTTFLTVFLSYQDDERVIMKDSVQWRAILDSEEIKSLQRDLNRDLSRPCGIFSLGGYTIEIFILAV